MIRRQLNGSWLLITQPDHARLAGEFARRWGNDEFTKPEPRKETILAIAEHDNGWRELDATADLNPANGLPYHFSERPFSDHFALWARAETRFLDRNPYASLLISRHRSTLFRYLVDTHADPLLAHPYFARESWLRQGSQLTDQEQRQIFDFVRERESFQEKLQRRLLADSSFADAAATAALNFNFRLLQVCDALSLYVCLGTSEEKSLMNVARGNWTDRVTLTLQPTRDAGVVVNPYPFDSLPLELQVTGRKLPVGPFLDAAELVSAWQQAERQTIKFTFRPT